ncbi:inorganic phosphate transporter [Amphritea sp.]|uniref:inorganic phosphate transporter n=1 Tax=Amphritea sp. TaxID=1872502 RepID=UPI0025B80C15|nr:inorganic phosphate transporter [Amphritea sp.]
MDINNLHHLEAASAHGRKEFFRSGTALLFIVGIMLYTSQMGINSTDHIMLVVAAMIGGYMAMNIGANDVANNVGPAVGSNALTMTGAILIAIIFEASGALIAGGDVVSTIKKGIIDPSLIPSSETFIWLMMAALLAGAIWLNVATVAGAPVSTTHSIVGGILGAGVAAGGWEIANWSQLGSIASSWVISPVLGGIIAASFLYLIKRTITYQDDMISSAKRMVPLLVLFMTWAFSTYLMMKGFKKIWKVDLVTALLIGAAVASVIFLIVRPLIHRAADRLKNDKDSVNSLFTVPLIFAAALLSFAHGGNDVANAVGPLAAINDAVLSGGLATKAPIPLWVMMIGAIGIAIGLALYGPKLIRTVGSEITELDKMRAFCVAMAAAITVIIASQLGLPVSSTHIAVGGIFGVGFLREFLKASYTAMTIEIMHHHENDNPEEVEAYLAEFGKASIQTKGEMLKQLKTSSNKEHLSKHERKELRKVYKNELVKRSALLKIAAAWVITVPASALMAAIIYFTIRGMMLP